MTEPESFAVARYDFHDPAFVTWWLNSLYLFPIEDQIAIAQLLRSAVHAPGPRREVDAFLEMQALELVRGAVAEGSPPTLGVDSGALGGWQFALRDAWRARPWLTGAGVLACAFFVFKGITFLLRYTLAA